MKTRITIAFLIIFLVSCTPSPAIPVDAQNTAMAVVQTYIALTQTAAPTPTVIPTATPEATLIPTLPPPPILTPDAVQVERWQEYQTELAKSVLSGYLGLDPDIYKYALCEWDILQGSSQELYVWAYCSVSDGRGADFPTVVYLEADGSVQSVEVPSRGSTWESDIKKMFPKEVQEKFDTYTGYSLFDGRIKEFKDHLNYREQHPEEPPLVVLSFTSIAIFESTVTPIYPTPSPLPTLPPPPILTPDAVQVERWREYETALAKSILPMFEYMVLCEWDILGRSELEVYVWATCRIPGGDDSRPAVIRLGTDGSIQEVVVPRRGHSSDVDELFPQEIQEKFSFYELGATFDGRRKEMYDHLVYRETHPEEPPLIILSVMPAIPPTP